MSNLKALKSFEKSRRKFVRDIAVATAGFFIVPRHVLGGKGFTAPSDKLIIAGIGVGGKGHSDLKYFLDSGKATIAFLCDVDEKQSANTRKLFPNAEFYHDYREMIEKEHKNFDAASVSTPDHNHAIQAYACMQLGKHVYVQKPLTHDIYEARILTEAAEKFKVVTQMGNQGASGDGVRILQEWYNAGIIGEVSEVFTWTDRPVWPQGISWPTTKGNLPETLKWDLWLGSAPYKEYIDGMIPALWRGWWDYGTGALGDMGCHIMEPPYRVLNLGYPTEVTCSVSSYYTGFFQRGYFPDSAPAASSTTIKFPANKKRKEVLLHWMDGGIQPDRPNELKPNDLMVVYLLALKEK
jgi:predicted dehydrogenase